MTLRNSIERHAAFIDTSAFQALADENDGFHRDALRIQAQLVNNRWRLVSSNYVLAETHAALLRRVGRAAALTFLEQFLAGPIRLIRLKPEDEFQAISILRRFTDKDFSFTDAGSFVVMERLGIDQAFAFDADFVRYGFTLVT